jgi:hypothetical protein
VYLASLVVRGDPTTRAAEASEVEAALGELLASPPPEHHRIRHHGDAFTVVCFVSAASESEAHLLIDQLRRRVAVALAAHPGWSLDGVDPSG